MKTVFSRFVDLFDDASCTSDESGAAAQPVAGPEVSDRIRTFCEEVQVAGNDYHARITAGQIVNLLAGRDANDDGELLRC